MTPVGVGKSIGSCRGKVHFVPGCRLVPWGQVFIK